MSFEDLYKEVILDHHQHPRCTEPLLHYNARSSGMNPSCGDEVTVRLNILGGRVEGVYVAGKGCAISTAAGSMFAAKVKGVKTDELRSIAETIRIMLTSGNVPEDADIGDLEALVGVSRFPVRVKCAMLPIATALKAVASHEANGRENAS
jgi:nitrogen fixation NifU-like protein